MAKVINLNKVRKQKARAEKDRVAETNRRLHGRTKAERAQDELQRKRLTKAVEGARLEASTAPADTVTFRFAHSRDVPAIVALVESAYRGDTSRKGWTTEADLLGGQRTDPAEVEVLLADEKTRLILGCVNDALHGCVVVRAKGQSAYVGMLTVDPRRQASGLGRQLLEAAERCAAQVFALSRVHMTVIVQREELIRWYERRGYASTGRREPFPYGDARFGVPKRPDLEFIVLEKSL